jgi:type IV secretory pathway VirB10-like protein
MIVATNLTHPLVPVVKRHNTVPLLIAGFVVFILVAAYIVVLASHQKKDVLTSFHQDFTTTKPVYEAAANVSRPTRQEDTPPPPATTEKKDEDPWAKMERENALKWGQMQWDHKVKAAEASFSRSQKLIETRATERQQALRAPSEVDMNGKKDKLQSPLAALVASRMTGEPSLTSTPVDTMNPSSQPSQSSLMAQPSLTQQPGLQHASPITTAALVPPVSPFLLRQGTRIPVSLDQWLNSDAQGAWTARVTADVYDSINSKYLLIPSNSQFEFLGGVEREMAVETLEHEGEELRPTGKTEIARQRSQVIKEGLTAH